MSDNKALVQIAVDGKRRKVGLREEFHLKVVELTVEDERDEEVAFIEIRRQPDNEISVTVYGKGTEAPLFQEVVRRGKDRRRQDAGHPPKLSVLDMPVAEGA